MTRVSCVSNQASREAFVRRVGGGGISKQPRAGERESESVRDQLGTGGERGRNRVSEDERNRNVI